MTSRWHSHKKTTGLPARFLHQKKPRVQNSSEEWLLTVQTERKEVTELVEGRTYSFTFLGSENVPPWEETWELILHREEMEAAFVDPTTAGLNWIVICQEAHPCAPEKREPTGNKPLSCPPCCLNTLPALAAAMVVVWDRSPANIRGQESFCKIPAVPKICGFVVFLCR